VATPTNSLETARLLVVEKVTGDVIGCVGFYRPQRPWPGVDPVHGEATHVYTISQPEK